MSETRPPYGPAPARAWTPDPHRVAAAAIAVLDAGDGLMTLLGRLEVLAGTAATRHLSEALVVRILRAEEGWRTASRTLLDSLNDDEEEVLL